MAKKTALSGYIPANVTMPNPTTNTAVSKPFNTSFFEYLFLRGESIFKQGNASGSPTTVYTVPADTTLLLFSYDMNVLVALAGINVESELRLLGSSGGIEAIIQRIRTAAEANYTPTSIISHDFTMPIVISAGKSISITGGNANAVARCTISGLLISNNLL